MKSVALDMGKRQAIVLAALASCGLAQMVNAEDSGDQDVLLVWCQANGGTTTDLGNGVKSCCIPNWGCFSCASGGWEGSLDWCITSCTTEECCKAMGRTGNMCTRLDLTRIEGGQPGHDPLLGGAIIDETLDPGEALPGRDRDLFIPVDALDDMNDGDETSSPELIDLLPLPPDSSDSDPGADLSSPPIAQGTSVVGEMRNKCGQIGGTFTDLGNNSGRCCTAKACVTCTPTGCITECKTAECCYMLGLEGSSCIDIDVPEPRGAGSDLQIPENGLDGLIDTHEAPQPQDWIDLLMLVAELPEAGAGDEQAEEMLDETEEAQAVESEEAVPPLAQPSRRGRLVRGR
jgi:hypothetical protein